MIRIKVYKASHLLIGALIAVLVIALAVILIRYMVASSAAPVGSFQGANKVTAAHIADGKIDGGAALAATPSFNQGKIVEVVFDAPEVPAFENEHTDARDDEFIIQILPRNEAAAKKRADETRILIYHTHTHEAYQQTASDPYVETEKWRTLDQRHSVVAVGAALTEALSEKGFSVVHDTTDHESPKLSTAYTRSLKTLEKYGEGAFDLAIDLHRDAYGEATHNGVMSVMAGNRQTAQVMVLLGNGEGFSEKPDFSENYQLAQMLTERINRRAPGMCRDVMVKNGRYNQHIGRSLLIEVGHNLNTLAEALSAVPALAQALYEVLTPQ